jgi:hypothetical protein
MMGNCDSAAEIQQLAALRLSSSRPSFSRPWVAASGQRVLLFCAKLLFIAANAHSQFLRAGDDWH